MNKEEMKWTVFAGACVLIGWFFWFLYSGYGYCDIMGDSTVYLACLLKTTIYGSIGSICVILFWAFAILAWLARDKKA